MLKQPRNSKPLASDDIPIALRDLPERSPQVSWLKVGLAIFLSTSAITMGVVFWWWQHQSAQVAQESEAAAETAESPIEVDNILGHLPYEEAAADELVAVTSDDRIRLQPLAAERFQAMVADAQAAGITLVPLSGHRTIEEQEYLFFEVKAQRNQDASKRAEVSAPPGFSEHHTGYAIDIGDAAMPHTHLSEAFGETEGFKWLEENAARYSFELSFPPDNPQGIAYEPWHWRFVGDRTSLEIFYRAQNLPQLDERSDEEE